MTEQENQEQEDRLFWGSFQGKVTASVFDIGECKSSRRYIRGCDLLRTLIQIQPFDIQEQLKEYTVKLDEIYKRSRIIRNPVTIYDNNQNYMELTRKAREVLDEAFPQVTGLLHKRNYFSLIDFRGLKSRPDSLGDKMRSVNMRNAQT